MSNNLIQFPNSQSRPRCVDPFSVAAGSPILPRSFHQAANSPEQLIQIANKAAPDFDSQMAQIAKKLKLDFKNPGVKSIGRVGQKAALEKGGLVDQIMDPLRCSMFGNANQLARALEFFEPANNSAVLELKNQFARPDPESGMRRAKIVYALPTEHSATGYLLTEIQLRHPLMNEAYDETDVISKRIRAIDAGLMCSGSSLAYGSQVRLTTESVRLQRERVQKNTDAAKGTDLHKLEETRTFGMVGNTPFLVIDAPVHRTPVILRPDATTGTFVRDNSLFAVFNNKAYEPITAATFFEESRDIAMGKHGNNDVGIQIVRSLG